MNNISETAKIYAIKCHRDTNHLYYNKPYEHHLEMVASVAVSYAHLIPQEDWDNVLAGCWVHDVIEDCRQNYNDVLKGTRSMIVAELAYALTNEKGRFRTDRANKRYYEGIRATPFATFIKLCDRIANSTFSILTGSSMYFKYQKEYPEFKEHLFNDKYNDMFLHLERLYTEGVHADTKNYFEV